MQFSFNEYDWKQILWHCNIDILLWRLCTILSIYLDHSNYSLSTLSTIAKLNHPSIHHNMRSEMSLVSVYPFVAFFTGRADFQARFLVIPHFFFDVKLCITPGSWTHDRCFANWMDKQNMALQTTRTPAIGWMIKRNVIQKYHDYASLINLRQGYIHKGIEETD